MKSHATRLQLAKKLGLWTKEKQLTVLPTKIFQHYQHIQATSTATPRKNNLGELATQEVMNGFALMEPPKTGVFLFEDHKIARASFLLPDNCRKVSTRAFCCFLSKRDGWNRQQKSNGKQYWQAERFPSYGFHKSRYPQETMSM
ncbi:hypothetical protein ACFS07_07525 [Undibacterium arcticum]